MKRSISVVLATAAVIAMLAVAPGAQAANCGIYLGHKIVTNGGISCKKAKYVFTRYENGKSLPKGWTCGLSARTCFKGNKRFTFGLN